MVEFDSWFYEQGAHRIGPVALAEMQQLAAAGIIQGDVRVWRPALETWVRAVDAPELVAWLPAATTPAAA